MTKTQKNSIDDTVIDEDALLALSHVSGTELDSELCVRLLQSDGGKSKLKQIKHVPSEKSPHTKYVSKEILPVKQPIIATGSKPPLPQQTQPKCDFSINADDFKPAKYDVLDLQRMADKFAEMRKPKRIEEIIYAEVGGFNYTEVTRTSLEMMLGEAHNVLYKQQGKLDGETRANLQNSILKMMMVIPHLLQNSNRVKDWLNQHTSHPEPEMYGFATPDPVQPRKFVTDTQPRLSTTETNVVLGKRKRGCGHFEDGDDNDINRNSSDSRIEVKADWSRPRLSSKRRRVKK